MTRRVACPPSQALFGPVVAVLRTRKSSTSQCAMVEAMSERCKVRRLLSSACTQPRTVRSSMNSSQACRTDTWGTVVQCSDDSWQAPHPVPRVTNTPFQACFSAVGQQQAKRRKVYVLFSSQPTSRGLLTLLVDT